MLRRLWVVLAAVALVLGAAKTADADALKLGTLAPADSPWGQVFKVWARAVDQRSGGSVTLDWSWNGTAGDENDMVGKMRFSPPKLDGAAITAVGLGQIYPTVLVFQMPGLFANWAKLDAARNAVKGTLESKFLAQGFKALGWGDVGQGKIMSIGFAVQKPGDLTKGATYSINGDPIGPALFAAVGGINAKPLSVPDILPALGSAVQIINAPPLAAEQLQWASRMTHINTMTTGFGIGALVFAKATFDGLGDDVKQILAETGAVAANQLTSRIRRLDDAAFARLKNNLTAYQCTDADLAEWNAKFATTRASLKNKPFDGTIFDQVVAAAR